MRVLRLGRDYPQTDITWSNNACMCSQQGFSVTSNRPMRLEKRNNQLRIISCYAFQWI